MIEKEDILFSGLQSFSDTDQSDTCHTADYEGKEDHSVSQSPTTTKSDFDLMETPDYLHEISEEDEVYSSNKANMPLFETIPQLDSRPYVDI